MAVIFSWHLAYVSCCYIDGSGHSFFNVCRLLLTLILSLKKKTYFILSFLFYGNVFLKYIIIDHGIKPLLNKF